MSSINQPLFLQKNIYIQIPIVYLWLEFEFSHRVSVVCGKIYVYRWHTVKLRAVDGFSLYPYAEGKILAWDYTCRNTLADSYKEQLQSK